MTTQELIEKIANLDRVYGEKYYVALEDVLDLVKQLDEPQKVKIPQFVADVIEDVREDSSELEQAFQSAWWYESDEFTEWYKKKSNRNAFGLAWLGGYEVEKEKRYTVKIKAILGQYLERYYLNNEELTPQFKRTKPTGSDELPTFTRKELEEAGFGWVFDCPGVEVEEVQDDTKI